MVHKHHGQRQDMPLVLGSVLIGELSRPGQLIKVLQKLEEVSEMLSATIIACLEVASTELSIRTFLTIP
jgi:hypothetical protein